MVTEKIFEIEASKLHWYSLLWVELSDPALVDQKQLWKQLQKYFFPANSKIKKEKRKRKQYVVSSTIIIYYLYYYPCWFYD